VRAILVAPIQARSRRTNERIRFWQARDDNLASFRFETVAKNLRFPTRIQHSLWGNSERSSRVAAPPEMRFDISNISFRVPEQSALSRSCIRRGTRVRANLELSARLPTLAPDLSSSRGSRSGIEGKRDEGSNVVPCEFPLRVLLSIFGAILAYESLAIIHGT